MNVELIKNILPTETRQTIKDDVVKGLELRVYPNGQKSFYLYYRAKSGHERRPKIGDFGDVTLTEARKRAKTIVDKVARGEDPMAEWKAVRQDMTVGELYKTVMDGYYAQERFKTSGWRVQVEYLWRTHLSKKFEKLKLSEVTPPLIREWHSQYVNHVVTGNRALSVLSRMFKYAEEQELRSQNTNPCSLVKNHPERARSRYASEDEIRRVAPLLEKYAPDQPRAVAFLYLLMFSGSRPRAVERATWDQLQEIQVDGQTFGLLKFAGKTTSKTGEDEEVIVPPQAMKIIAILPRIPDQTICGIKMPRKLWAKIKKEAGCPDLWARDWRRTFATIGLSNGVSKDVIGKVLNHRSNDTTDVYAKLVDRKKVEATAAIANRLTAIIGGKSAQD